MPIGAPLSATAAARSDIEAAVRRGDPVATDSLLRASLERLAKFSKRLAMSDDPAWSCELLGYCIESGHSEARRLLDAAMLPAPKALIVKELTRLRLLTTARSADDSELSGILAVYADMLTDYPADAAIAAIRRWPREHKFWPAFAELAEEIWKTCEFRRMIKDALE